MNYVVGMNLVEIIVRKKSSKLSLTKFLFHREIDSDDTTKSYINFILLFIFNSKSFETDDGSLWLHTYVIIVFRFRRIA